MTGIYCIKNKVNNKVYIGQSVDVKDRLWHHKSSLKHNRHENDYLQKAWNKYGEDCFEFIVLEYCSEEELNEKEISYIALYNSTNRDFGYNFETGGSLHKHMSVESRKKMSEAKKGKYIGEKNPMYGVHLKISEERKRKLSEMFKGKKMPPRAPREYTDEDRRKMSERVRGEKNPFFNKHHTEEAKRRMSEKKKGVRQSWESVLKRGQTKRVKCLNNGMVFESLSKAAEWAKTTASESISRVCKHKQKTAGWDEITKEKYIWEYA